MYIVLYVSNVWLVLILLVCPSISHQFACTTIKLQYMYIYTYIALFAYTELFPRSLTDNKFFINKFLKNVTTCKSFITVSVVSLLTVTIVL